MSQTETQPIPKPQDDGEISINFGEIFKTLKAFKFHVLIFAFVFSALGATYSLTQSSEYVSVVKLLPEIDSKSSAGGLGGLKSLAGLAGIDVGGGSSGSEAIRPDLYPNIVQSLPFLQEAAKAKIYISKKKKWMIASQFLNDPESRAPLKIFASTPKEEAEKIRDIELINIPKEGFSGDLVNLGVVESSTLMNIKSRITLEIDKKSGVISITVKMPDPVGAANMTSFTQQYLTKYVVNYRTEKARTELSFLQTRYAEAKKTYDQAQFTFSNYKDQNRNVFLNVVKDQEKRLQYEVDLAYNVYAALSQQLTDAQVKIHRETPVFKVLEPAQIPLSRSEPKRTLITIGFMVVGVFISLIYIFFKSVNLKQLFS